MGEIKKSISRWFCYLLHGKYWIRDERFNPTEHVCEKCGKYRGEMIYNPWAWFFARYDYDRHFRLLGFYIKRK